MISKSQGRGHKWLWLLFLVPNGEVNENVLEGSGKIAGFTYYCLAKGSINDCSLRVEMMHPDYDIYIEIFPMIGNQMEMLAPHAIWKFPERKAGLFPNPALAL